jgi:multicomponent Na+:H+ antiporter subunit E
VTRVAAPARSRVGALARAGGTAAVAFGFYLALGDPTDPFDLVTGLASAVVVAAVLGRVTFERSPSVTTLVTIGRAAVFLPGLLVAVVRSNLALAAVVLDPRLPIDPAVVRVPAPEGAVARALLANSITLTPGTLTVDVTDDELVVHTLTAESRADLEAGSLQRTVAAVCGAGADTAADAVEVGADTAADAVEVDADTAADAVEVDADTAADADGDGEARP